MYRFSQNQWAVILGGSGGFGAAAGQKLAEHGMNLCLAHRDRRGAMQNIEPVFESMRATGARVVTANVDALSEAGRASVLDALEKEMGPEGRVRVVLHAIASGNLKALAPRKGAGPAPLLDEEDFSRTIHAMGTSLAQWVQDIFSRKLFAPDARVLSLTSEGSSRAWHGYAAVSTAKAALEALTRSLALEYGPHGIRANVIQAGVSDTKALAAIPGHEAIMDAAVARNPLGRATLPKDVADVIFLLSQDEAAWINGALIRADGGESIG